MRQDSDTNIIVLNTALKYKIQRNTQKKHKFIKYTKYKHILKKESVQKPERSIAPGERLKAFTEEKLVTSHGKLFQTLITRSGKKHKPGCITATMLE